MIRQKDGYSLVLIVLMSTFILAVLAGALRIVTQSYIYSQEEYYYKLAQEAGEAGTAYANACLDANNAEQSWSSATGGIGPLRPNTNCKGAAAFHSNKYVLDNGKVRTTFEVGNLEASTKSSALSAATAQISATGRVEVVGGGSKTYVAVVKKSVTWPADLDATRTVSGTGRTCAILSNNVWCWGDNSKGQLGDGTMTSSETPVKVRSIGDMIYGKIIDMFAAQHHNCVLTQLGSAKKVYCWGDNEHGQLGNGRSGAGERSNIPVEVGGAIVGKNVTAIGGSGDVSCAIADGKIYCWGRNDYGQLGSGSPGNPARSVTPVEVASGTDPTWRLPAGYTAKKLSTSGSRAHSMCAIITTGTAYCWGQANYGQNGSGPVSSTYNYGQPVRVVDISNVTDISQDGYTWASYEAIPYLVHVCAVASGKVYCWGGSGRGQSGSGSYGSGSYQSFDKPVQVKDLPGTALRVEVGIAHSCALVSDAGKRKMYCWGTNQWGQLGVNNSGVNHVTKPRPVYVGTDGLPVTEEVVDIAAGANRGCALMTNKRAYCWGLNHTGQIGDGTKDNRYNPTESLFLRPLQNRYIY